MADIDVTRKGPSIWPWIIGLLVLALLIWGLAEMLGDDDDDIDPITTEEVIPAPVAVEDPGLGAVPPVVTEFAETCAVSTANADMGAEHRFTTDCVRRMTAALDGVIQRNNISGTDVDQRLANFRQMADALEGSSPEATDHANMVRNVFMSASDLMSAVYQASYSTVQQMGPEVTQIRDAAQAIQGDTQLLNQQDAVTTFFREAGEAIRMMATTPAAA